MSQAWTDLGGRRRTLARQVYARDRTDPYYTCPVCHQPIDWALPYTNPTTGAVNTWSKSVDHSQELQDGGAILDLDNCWTAHLGCNSAKGATRRWQRQRQSGPGSDSETITVDLTTL